MHAPLVFPVVPDGHVEHLRYSFSMGNRTEQGVQGG
jgi:hypothetical protein